MHREPRRGSIVSYFPPSRSRELDLSGGFRRLFASYEDALAAIAEVRTTDGARVRRSPALGVDVELEMSVTIRHRDGARRELLCRSAHCALRASPSGRVRGFVEYGARLDGIWSPAPIGRFEVDGRIVRGGLEGTFRVPMSRRPDDRISFVAPGSREAGWLGAIEGEFCPSGARARLTFDGLAEFSLVGPAGAPISRGGGLSPEVVGLMRSLGARCTTSGRASRERGAEAVAGESAIEELLEGWRWPRRARYGNHGVTVPRVSRLRWFGPSADREVDPERGLFHGQGAREFVFLGRDEADRSLLVLARDTRHPADPYIYRVAGGTRGHKLGNGTRLTTFLRTLYRVR
jgi:hypothetical protein